MSSRPIPNYPNLQLDELESIMKLFKEGIADAEDVHEVVDSFEASALELLAAVPGALRSAELQLQRDDNQTLRHLARLVERGSELLNQGLNELELYLLEDKTGPESLLKKLQASNNCLCHSARLVQSLFSQAA